MRDIIAATIRKNQDGLYDSWVLVGDTNFPEQKELTDCETMQEVQASIKRQYPTAPIVEPNDFDRLVNAMEDVDEATARELVAFLMAN